MTIPLLDLKAQYESLREELAPQIERVLSGTQFILGEDVELFEQRFADYCGVDFCIAVSSGTEALHLALRGLGIGAGDEVITAANSFVASAFSIAHAGASPVLVDVNPDDYNINVDLIEQAVTRRTKAIMPVHLYGQPAEMAGIRRIADEHGLRIIEDASQAHGALYGERPVGSLGDVGCFSFYPGKNLGAYGDGGAIVTNNAQLAADLRAMRNYGQERKHVYSRLGYNARLDTLQAAILLVKMRFIEEWNEGRRLVAARYRELLEDVPVLLPHENEGVRHVYHLFVIQHPRRDELLEYLKDRDILCGVHYPAPLHEVGPLAAHRTVPENAPVSSALAGQILSLPMYAELTEEQIQTVVEGVRSFTCTQVPA